MDQIIQTLKGFRDFLPAEAVRRQWLKFRLVNIFEQWGFGPLETPTLEPLELFSGQIGEDEKLFFKFTDQGGRNVALRYDQTVPTCRVIGQYKNELVFPFKRYQIQPAYRAEKPQKGRYREFVQCDADIFGVQGPIADAEMIALSLDIYRQLGFTQVIVRINNRELLKEIPYEAIVTIDKMKKIGEDAVIEEMIQKGIDKSKGEAYLKVIQTLKPDETITTIMEYLKNYGFPDNWYVFDPTIARSFSYSMGPIWEVEIPRFSSGSVLGGERFDGLVESLTGEKIAGTGFGLGFDRTLEAADLYNLIPNLSAAPQILVTIFSKDLLQKSLEVVQTIRSKDINAELFTDTEVKLEKQLKYADKKGITWCLILGPDEIEKNMVQLKNMKTRESKQLPIMSVVQEMEKR